MIIFDPLLKQVSLFEAAGAKIGSSPKPNYYNQFYQIKLVLIRHTHGSFSFDKFYFFHI